ncbi:MAG: TetR family transcriptional regulator, partial [Micropepsaceae bacterium]
MRTKSKTLRMPRGRPPLSSDQVDMMRKRIADAARRLFRDEGFEAVSMRRLATEAGCTPMSLYTYFDGKIDVLRSVWGDV